LSFVAADVYLSSHLTLIPAMLFYFPFGDFLPAMPGHCHYCSNDPDQPAYPVHRCPFAKKLLQHITQTGKFPRELMIP
jgi:hypothetical protein